ncbi:DUF4198 domain-containing protein [Gemmata sp. JC717]|uniref:DUF4198 domain-containing protein n=1 Tax=Gemmata algarum TaxID=2975278 RepID=A0ABU5F8J5_9BACT|nr:DUF4198 domain-containing protein [Gemmata algarum]MDY3554313.1 DUF4198 domain-containing protein [Gemmata algarum]MDY3562708.1 DUF4198 domain-containing protein [Gemmata algarum]
MKLTVYVFFLTLALVGGCGSPEPEVSPATVRGRVVLNGQPVAGGLVVFAPHPDRGGTGKVAYAETGSDGGYALRLEQATAIPPGWYRVALAPAPTVTPGPGPLFPAKLARPDMSGIEREVKPGQQHVFEFVVEVPKD